MQIDLEIQRATSTANSPEDQLFQQWIEAIPGERSMPGALTIRIVDEQEVKRLNKGYRNRDYATNVLSFPAELPVGLPTDIRQSQLGDILICAPVVAREAAEQGCTEKDHWAHLTIHGVLHLLGYDHLQTEEAVVMEALETKILAKLGISDPYKDNI